MRFLALIFVTGCAPMVVVAGGDVQLGRRSSEAQLAAVRSLLRGNLCLINLEGPLSDGKHEDEAARRFVAPTRMAAWLRGIDAGSLANNHALDQGESGLADTRRALELMGVVGVVDQARLRGVTLLARHFSYDKNLDDEVELVEAVRRAPRPVLVTLHWGHPGDLLPTAAQRRLAARLVDAGASAVLGHGPHTIQGVERRGRAVIAYSLGNLAYSCDCTDVRDAYLLRFRLRRDGGVENVETLPIQAGLEGAPPRASDDPDLRALLDQLSKDLLSPARGD